MPSEELVDVVDEDDQPVEVRSLRECFRLGLLHRAVAVLLRDSRGRILLQKRSMSKLWCPGYWTLSAGGHVRAGESYEKAAKRELLEEMGVSCDLTYVAKFLDKEERWGEVTESEHISIFEGTYSGEIRADGVEVETSRYVTPRELLEMSRSPDPELTPDAIHAIEAYLGARPLAFGSKPS